MRALIIRAALICLAAGTAAAQSYRPVDFNQLSDFDYELPDPLDPAPATTRNAIPDAIKRLDGALVSIDGFMLPLDLTPEGVTAFLLNASIDMCYFGAPVRMNEWILVTMKGGKRARFTHLATKVRGRLSVGEQMRNGRVASLYRLEADSAEGEGGR